MASKISINEVVRNSEPDVVNAFLSDISQGIDLMPKLLGATGIVLAATAGAPPYRLANSSSVPLSIRWRYDAAAANYVLLQETLQREYVHQKDELHAWACLRLSGTTTDAPCNVQMVMRFFTPGLIDPTIAAATVPTVAAGTAALGDTSITSYSAVKRALLAPVALALTNYAWYRFDLSLATAGAGTATNRKRGGDIFNLEIGPDAVVDAGNAKLLDMCGLFLCGRNNVAFLNKGARTGKKFLV